MCRKLFFYRFYSFFDWKSIKNLQNLKDSYFFWYYLVSFSDNQPGMSPLSTKVEFCRLYPNWLIYLFLAVFAFSSPFCYAKTAFWYSRDILSPCTPVLFMVKDVVKTERRMIVMWSCFQVVEALENCFASREEIYREQRRCTTTYTCGQPHAQGW